MKDILLLKQALPYLRRHKGKTFIVKLGGELAASPDALTSLAEDLSLLSHVGIRIVIVHGGGPQASDLSRRLGMEPTMVDGRRVTDADTLDIAKMVFAGKINVDILSALRVQGVRAVGLSGVDADILRAERRLPTEVRDEVTGETRMVDYGYVGDVTEVDSSVLRLLVDNGYVPVLSSLCSDESGNILNINADTVASVLARDLEAAKLISMTSVPGILRSKEDPDSLIPVLTVAGAAEALSNGVITAGMKPKVKSLVDAVQGGVSRGHILSGLDSGALLLELFTREGSGTLIVLDDDSVPDHFKTMETSA
jgi:acetylglutamate kinase